MSEDLRLAAALSAYDAGCSVIPIAGDGTKKTSLTQWNPYRQKRATREQIAVWMADHTGYAIVCGPASGNLEVLDFDSAETYQAFLEAGEALGLGELLGRLRSGYEERTPDGGTHLPYRCMMTAGNTKLAKRPGPPKPEKPNEPTVETLIETRGDGGYFIAAPSNGRVHPSGRAWVKRAGGFDTLPNIEPEERAQLFALARSFDEMPIESADATPAAPRASGEGKRPGEVFREQHGTLDAFRGIVEPHGWKMTHRRGEVGYFRRPGKDDGWSATFAHAGSDLFYPFTSSTAFEAERGYNVFSVFAILNHGGDFTAAARELGKQGYGDPLPIERPAGAPSSGGAQTATEAPPATEEDHPRFALTDMGNAERFIYRHRGNVRYCPELGSWLIWEQTTDAAGAIRGGRWLRDENHRVYTLAQHAVRSIYDEANREDEIEERQKLAKHAIRSEATGRIEAMVKQAQWLDDVTITTAELDQDAWLLNVANGTVDLRTGKLRRPRKEDFITRMVPVPYDPDAPRDTWRQFLERIFTRPGNNGQPTVALMDYAQRLFGYATIGDPRERILPILWGGGRNGKTTMLEAICDTLGSGYAGAIDPALLYSKRDESQNQQHIAQLWGMRIVVAVEGGEDQKLDSALVKRITGRDTLKGRFLYKNQFSFTPTHVIALATNHKPRVSDSTASIWDRLRLVPFGARFFSEDEQEFAYAAEWQKADRLLPERLKQERTGILAWLIEGAVRYAKDGLKAPAIVMKSTNEYKAGEDIVGRFIGDCCLTMPDASVPFRELYDAYALWHADATDGDPTSEKAFGRRLTEKGFQTDTEGTGKSKFRVRRGLRLRAAGDVPLDTPPGGESGTNTTIGTDWNHSSEKSSHEDAIREKLPESRFQTVPTDNGSTSAEDESKDEGVTF